MRKIKIQCPSCEGYGIYKGMAERNNCAVVCYKCEGKGFVYYQYEVFKKLKIKENINRIFKDSCGYVHTDKNINNIKFEDGGCTYKEWLSGVEPKPVKDLYCPYLWTNQDLQCNDINDLHKNRCSKGLSLGRISKCLYYKDKVSCWKIYEGVI